MSSFKPAVSVCVFLSCAIVAHADNADAPDQSAQRHQLEIQAQALAQIIKAADQICSTPPLTTSSDHLELNGQAQAALTGALKKITDLGISGAAKYTQGHSNGVLQEQLAAALKDGNNCKLTVLKQLQSIIPGLSNK